MTLKHGILIYGGNDSTGYGKSTLALCLARDYAVQYNKAFDKPKSEAMVSSARLWTPYEASHFARASSWS